MTSRHLSRPVERVDGRVGRLLTSLFDTARKDDSNADVDAEDIIMYGLLPDSKTYLLVSTRKNRMHICLGDISVFLPLLLTRATAYLGYPILSSWVLYCNSPDHNLDHGCGTVYLSKEA